MRIVVTGRNGQVAQSLLERAQSHRVEIITVGRPDLDLTNAETIRPALLDLRPDAIVSAAAYTAVDKAESEPDTAYAANALGPEAIAAVATELNVPLLHLSTDYVYAGDKLSSYSEGDPTEPQSVYGRSKLAGENLVAAKNKNAVILRTAWVYSPFGANFLKTMLRFAQSRDRISVVADQLGCPTSAIDIADALIALARRLRTDPDLSLRGVFHLSGAGEASWADFAEEIFAELERLTGKQIAVDRIRTIDYPTPAKRPANSRLSTKKLREIHAVELPDWRQSTRAVVRRLVEEQSV